MLNKAHDPKVICNRFERLSEDRGIWEGEWQTIADLINPTTDFTREQTPGQPKRYKQFDGTATKDQKRLASAVYTLIMNPAIQWITLAVDDNEPVDDESAKWLQDRSLNLLNFYASRNSGVTTGSWEILNDITSFGTGIMCRKPRGASKMPKYYSVPLSSIYVDADDSGDVVGCYRQIQYDPRDLATDFGEENLSEKTLKLVKQAREGKGAGEKITVIHAIFQNKREYEGDRSPFKHEWASVYIEREQKHTLSEGGFRRNPYIVARWSRNSGEIYGRSPAWECLPNVKAANVIKRDGLIAGELQCRPPMMVPANSVEGPIRTAPGSINYYMQGSRDRPEPMQTGANPDVSVKALIEERTAIGAAYFSDLLTLPDQDRMTAEEVITRRNQKLEVMAPVLARLISEFLGPMIHADYSDMREKGLFPPSPAGLEGRTVKVEYRSPMAIAQKASQVNNAIQFIGAVTPLFNTDPNLAREIDGSETMRDVALAMNATLIKFRPKEEVSAQLEQERQAAMQTQSAAAAKDLAGAGKDAATAADTIATSEGLRIAR